MPVVYQLLDIILKCDKRPHISVEEEKINEDIDKRMQKWEIEKKLRKEKKKNLVVLIVKKFIKIKMISIFYPVPRRMMEENRVI